MNTGGREGWEWKSGREEAFSSLATLFLAQGKTGRLLALVYPTLRKGRDPHPVELGLGHGGLALATRVSGPDMCYFEEDMLACFWKHSSRGRGS